MAIQLSYVYVVSFIKPLKLWIAIPKAIFVQILACYILWQVILDGYKKCGANSIGQSWFGGEMNKYDISKVWCLN